MLAMSDRVAPERVGTRKDGSNQSGPTVLDEKWCERQKSGNTPVERYCEKGGTREVNEHRPDRRADSREASGAVQSLPVDARSRDPASSSLGGRRDRLELLEACLHRCTRRYPPCAPPNPSGRPPHDSQRKLCRTHPP